MDKMRDAFEQWASKHARSIDPDECEYAWSAWEAAWMAATAQCATEIAALQKQIGEPLTDERIDYIADITSRGMENGIRGFMTAWGWRQFARALIEACGNRAVSKPGEQA